MEYNDNILKNSTLYLLTALITFIIGYLYLRFAYDKTSEIPFVQEIVLVVLGTIVTIAITAALLNKQSEVEIEKEQRVKIFDLKSNLYFELIDLIEGVLTKDQIKDDDMIRLEFLTHKISTVASPRVLKEYSGFLQYIKGMAKDHQISSEESDTLSMKLGALCSEIRYDLVPHTTGDLEEIKKIILDNIDIFT